MAMDEAWLITALPLDDAMDQGLWNAMNLGLARDHFVIGLGRSAAVVMPTEQESDPMTAHK
jgi:hypothetical protein